MSWVCSICESLGQKTNKPLEGTLLGSHYRCSGAHLWEALKSRYEAAFSPQLLQSALSDRQSWCLCFQGSLLEDKWEQSQYSQLTHEPLHGPPKYSL